MGEAEDAARIEALEEENTMLLAKELVTTESYDKYIKELEDRLGLATRIAGASLAKQNVRIKVLEGLLWFVMRTVPIDDVALRVDIGGALSRVEAYHDLG